MALQSLQSTVQQFFRYEIIEPADDNTDLDPPCIKLAFNNIGHESAAKGVSVWRASIQDWKKYARAYSVSYEDSGYWCREAESPEAPVLPLSVRTLRGRGFCADCWSTSGCFERRDRGASGRRCHSPEDLL